MSKKVNISGIIRGHIQTLTNADSEIISRLDIFTFYLLPLALSITALIFGFNLNRELVSLLVNFGSIFTALLLSVLVLVYDQECKLNEKGDTDSLYTVRKELLHHLYYNISYSIICSITLVITAFAHTTLEKLIIPISIEALSISYNFFVNEGIITPIVIFISANLILTIIMIVKRMHALLTTQ